VAIHRQNGTRPEPRSSSREYVQPVAEISPATGVDGAGMPRRTERYGQGATISMGGTESTRSARRDADAGPPGDRAASKPGGGLSASDPAQQALCGRVTPWKPSCCERADSSASEPNDLDARAAPSAPVPRVSGRPKRFRVLRFDLPSPVACRLLHATGEQARASTWVVRSADARSCEIQGPFLTRGSLTKVASIARTPCARAGSAKGELAA
jgi:hypothetical protein